MNITVFEISLLTDDPEALVEEESVTINQIEENSDGFEVYVIVTVEVENEVFCEYSISLFIETFNHDGVYEKIQDSLINHNSRLMNLIKTMCRILHNNRF